MQSFSRARVSSPLTCSSAALARSSGKPISTSFFTCDDEATLNGCKFKKTEFRLLSLPSPRWRFSRRLPSSNEPWQRKSDSRASTVKGGLMSERARARETETEREREREGGRELTCRATTASWGSSGSGVDSKAWRETSAVLRVRAGLH